MSFYGFMKGIAGWAFKLAFPTKVIGPKKLENKKTVFAVNHLSNMDPIIVGCKLKPRFYFWGKKELFKRKIPAPVEQDEVFINIIEVIYTNLRCQGMASSMLQKIIEIAKEEKVYQVRAYCDIGNVPSHRLWLKNKFSISPVKMPDGSIAGSFVSFVLC